MELERRDGVEVVVGGRRLVAFAGCDYLGLARHPEVIAALTQAAARWGLSAGASPTTTGRTAEHGRLEAAIASFLGVEAAILVPDGYLTNLAAAQSLAPPHGRALVHPEAHPSVLDALRAAQVEAFTLVDAAGPGPDASLVWTDGVLPVAGRLAPLPALLARLPEDGVLVVDDAHGVGVVGPGGRGTVAAHGLADKRIATCGTFSKALGGVGGFVAGSAGRVGAVRERSRVVSGSTALAPALAAAATAALALVTEARVAALRANVARVREALADVGLPLPPDPTLPIFAMRPGGEAQLRALADALAGDGLLCPYVRYADRDMLRFTVSAAHRPEHLDRLHESLRRHSASALSRR